MTQIVRLTLLAEASLEELEEDVALAIFVSECLHGRPQARLDTSYLVNPTASRCVVAVRGPAGETAVRVLVGLVSERFGEDAFRVERLEQEGAA